MKNYALIENGIVINISIADDSWDSTGWVQYTKAGIGWSYDGVNFIAPQPYPSWLLDENFDWQAPTPRPTEGFWYWDEPTLTWIESTFP